MFRRLCIAVAVLFLSLAWFPLAKAATVDPESATLTVAPGDKVHQTVRFENNGSDTQTYTLKLSKVSFGSSADDLRFSELNPTERNQISLDRSSFTLEAGADQAVEVTVTAPSDALAQVFSFAVIAVAQAEGGSGVAVTSGTASLLFVNIGGGLVPHLGIESFATIPNAAHKLPLRFAALGSNVGPGLATPDVAVAIKNVWGKQVALVPLNPTSRRVPGYTNRVFSAEWADQWWRFGPYTATLYVFPDSSAAAPTAKTNVVLFAWQPLVVFLALAAILAAGTYAFLRARRH